MASRNVEKLRAIHTDFNRNDIDAVTREIPDDLTYVDHGRGLTLRSRKEFSHWLTSWKQAFSDAHLADIEYIDGGDVVVAQFQGQGTNDGQFGPFPATRRRIDFPLCEVWHFDANGRIIRGENYYDQMSILTQLGHIQKPAAA
jgi:steroid delta-isomerase-like uncharacterized protein